MLFFISSNPVFQKWLDAASLRNAPRFNKICPAKSAADWFNLAEADERETHMGERNTASQHENIVAPREN